MNFTVAGFECKSRPGCSFGFSNGTEVFEGTYSNTTLYYSFNNTLPMYN